MCDYGVAVDLPRFGNITCRSASQTSSVKTCNSLAASIMGGSSGWQLALGPALRSCLWVLLLGPAAWATPLYQLL
jgi:hypothetical protein